VSKSKGDGTPSDNTGKMDFEPVNPWKSVERRESLRHLPHLETPQSTYLVTFRCHDGLFLPAEARDIVFAAIRHWDRVRIDLDGAVVMPDHVHIMLRVLEGRSLSSVLQSIKGFSSRAINQLLRRKGAFWLDESFDHIIRNEQEWEEKLTYIRDNPVKGRLVERWQHYRWLWLKDDRLESLSH
jgi:REP element-mobilizing transposase RayT